MADASLDALESDLQAALEGGNDRIIIDAQNTLAWQLRSGAQDDRQRAHEIAQQAGLRAKEIGYTLGEARALRCMGMTIPPDGSLYQLYEWSEEARRLFDLADEAEGRAGARDFLASLHEYMGDLSGAFRLALDALAIARDHDLPIRQAYALSNVGAILAESGDVEPGVARLREALDIFTAEGHQDGIHTIQQRLAKALRQAGHTEEAMALAETFKASGEAANDPFLVSSGLALMADAQSDRGQAAEAEANYRAAFEMLPTEQVKGILGSEYRIGLVKSLLERGALDEAEPEVMDAIVRLGEDTVSAINGARLHELAADLREAQGRFPDSVRHLRIARRFRQQLEASEAKGRAMQMELRAILDDAKKTAEMERLRFEELHAMQAKLLEAEKMALLGRLAAGTAHEMNTPLGVLRANASLTEAATVRLLEAIGPDDTFGPRVKKLAVALEASRESSGAALTRLSKIAGSFLRFTELDEADRQRFDLRDGLEGTLVVFEPTLPERIRLERNYGRVPAIEGCPRELNHAFLTVLQNGADAIAGDGLLVAETATDPDTGDALVRIRDNGRGMSETERRTLFDVGFGADGRRTKMRLGLAAAAATMDKHGGLIEVMTAPGKGTTFTLRFPSQASISSDG